MVERHLKGLYYNYDGKYFSRNICKEKKMVMTISKDISHNEANEVTPY
jgi:hypothetical protein